VRCDSFTGVSIPIAVHGTDLVFPTGSVTLVGPLSAIAAEAAMAPGPPEGVYDIVDPLARDAVLDLDAAAAEWIYRQPLRRWACTETSSDREPHPTVRGVSPSQAL
jgi:hypothetical protein